MATSGRMQGNSVTIGSQTNNFYFIDWQLAGQNIAGNYSTINWQCYMHYTSADAQLDNGYATLGGATRWSNGGRVYNYAGNFTTRDMGISSGSFTVGHDSAGNFTLDVSGNIVVYSGMNSGGSASWALPTIPRYAAYLSGTPYAQNITGVSFDVAVQPDVLCDNLATSLDGGAWVYWPGDFNGWKVVTLGGNLTAGAVHTFKTSIRRKDSQQWTESTTKNVTTLAPAAITTYSSSLTDEGDPFINFTNPTGSTMDVWLEVNPSGTHYAVRNSIPNTGSYTWTLTNEERDQLRAVIPNSNTGTIRLGLYTNLGGTHTYSSYKDIPFSIVNANPTFSTVSYLDTNSATTTITGNNQYIIQGYSTLRAVINSTDKAVALKSATMNKYTFNVSNISVEQAYSTDTINKDLGVLSSSTNQTLTINAVDSRNNSTAVNTTVNVVPYSAPVINATGIRLNNFEADTTLSVSGTFSRLTVGDTDKNTIASDKVEYRYKQDGGEFGSWTAMTRTLGAGTFTTTDVNLTLSNSSIFDFEIRVTDAITSTTTTLTVDRGVPILMISDNMNSVGVGMMPSQSDMLEVADDMTINGSMVAKDHGTATDAQVVNVCYGTSDTPPTASSTPIGTIYIQYIS